MFDPISRLPGPPPLGGLRDSPLLSLAQSLTSSLAQTLGLGPNRFGGEHRSDHRPSHYHPGPNHPAVGGPRGDGPRETHDSPGSRAPGGPSPPGAPGAGSTIPTTHAVLDRAAPPLATLVGQGASSSAPTSQAPSPQDAPTVAVARQLANSAAAAGGAAALAGPAGSAQAFQAAALSGAAALSTAAALAPAQAPAAAQAAVASGPAAGLAPAPGGMPAVATAAQAPAPLAGAAMSLAAAPPPARAEAQAAMARSDAPGVVADRAGAFAANAPGGTAASPAPAGATTASTAPAAMAAAGATLATMAAPAAPAVPASQSPADVRGHTGLSMGGERSGPGRADGALAQGHTVAAAGRRSLYGGDGGGRSFPSGLFAMIGVASQAARQELADLQKAELAYQWLYWVLTITAYASLGLLLMATTMMWSGDVSAYPALSNPTALFLLGAAGAGCAIGAFKLARVGRKRAGTARE
ncbi:hypothetical protein [Luteimonas huabeiensis]|uniref:hypothetical protein n=1 Tax=Luteimonas huabeiensis TaxID=1244513 RepID=UPI0004645FDE|nr:hypothetical protein [Luteimonas huabeiensis]